MTPVAPATKFSGSKIRQARHESGMTQAALAAAAGTRERNIIRWENDQHAPRFQHVAAIARATGKDIAFFVTADETDDEDDEEAARMRSHSFLHTLYTELGTALGKARA